MRSFSFLLGAIGIFAAVACTPSAAGEASTEAALEGTADFDMPLGKCSLGAPLANPALALPLPEDGHPLANVGADKILTKIELTAHFAADGATPVLKSIRASLARDLVEGTLTFPAGASLFTQKVDRDQHRAYEAIATSAAEPGTPIALGDQSFGVDMVTLWWEANGAWVVFAAKTETGPDVVATAPSCTFDADTWKVLAHPECAATVRDGAPAPEGADCKHSAKDTFAALDAPTTPPPASTPPATPPSPDPSYGGNGYGSNYGTNYGGKTGNAPAAETPDGSKAEPAKPAAKPRPAADAESDTSTSTETGKAPVKPATKAPAASASGCSVTPGTSEGAPWLLLATTIAGLGLARRRRSPR